MIQQKDLSRLFGRMADLLEIRGENVFRIRAYRRAAQTLDAFSGELQRRVNDGTLEKMSGIGKDLALKITEFSQTGQIQSYERLVKSMPKGVVDLLEVPGLGPKGTKLISEQLKVTNLRQLKAAAQSHRIRTLPGFSEKKEANLLKGMEILQSARSRMDLGTATALAMELMAFLKKQSGVKRVAIAGSLRRLRETIGDIDLLATAGQSGKVTAGFAQASFSERVLVCGQTKTSILTKEGVQVDLRVVAPEAFGAALQYFTGSKEHNVRLRERATRRGLKVNEYGVFRLQSGKKVAGREEEDVYKALELPWIPPEMREDTGEVEAAARGQLPSPVDLKDIRGDFHVHTNASDGTAKLEDLPAAGAARGYQYLVVTDHSRSLKVANGLSIERLRSRMRRIDALNRQKHRCRLLKGAEVDILPDGRMDYPDDVLKELDVVVGSVHSAFKQDSATMTCRILRAIHNPYVTILGHPTGRLMGSREGYAVDLDAIFKAAKDTGTALELNGQPRRLDLSSSAARKARDMGAMLAISTDSHSLAQLDQMTFGLGLARRAWVESDQVLNAMSLARLQRWVSIKRKRLGR